MVRAWSLRAPGLAAPPLAVGIAPVLVAALLLLASSRPPSVRELAGLGFVALVYEICFGWMELGRWLLSDDRRRFLARTLVAGVVGLGIAWLALRFLPTLAPDYRGAALMGIGSVGLLLVVRSFLPLLVERQALSSGVLVIGRGDLAAKLCLDLLERQAVERVARLEDLDGGGWQAGAVSIDPVELRRLVEREGISRIVVAEPDAGSRREIVAALLECRLLGVPVEDAADLYQRLHGKLWLEALDPERLAFAPGFRLTRVYVRVKRAYDLACAVVVLVAGAPLMGLVALLVRLESPGPVLYRQERVGQFGRRFVLLKFRSMRIDAERACGPTWAREHDDRVTRIGGLLRRFHLDELPQAINVLRGDLSLVGPRPERPCFVELLRDKLPFYDLRHYVKPGMTGWAQVCAPYASSIEDSYEKLQYDLAYAQHVSLSLDLEVIARTALKLLRGSGR